MANILIFRNTEPGLQTNSFYSAHLNFSQMIKKVFKIALMAILFLSFSNVSLAQSAKDRWRCQHVVKGLKLSKELSAKFSPVFYAYLKELHQAGDVYDNLKDKYKTQINKRQLSVEQAQQLLNAHWDSDEKQVQVRQKYTQLFGKILKMNYVFYTFK